MISVDLQCSFISLLLDPKLHCFMDLMTNELSVRVGQFCPFFEFHEKSWVCGSPIVQYGELTNFFDFGIKTKTPLSSIFSKNSKGQKIKIIFILIFCPMEFFGKRAFKWVALTGFWINIFFILFFKFILHLGEPQEHKHPGKNI